METAKFSGLEPKQYLAKTVGALASAHCSKLRDLLTWKTESALSSCC
ncbi:transposase domain-containing protein [Asticcacaulis benevestitus]